MKGAKTTVLGSPKFACGKLSRVTNSLQLKHYKNAVSKLPKGKYKLGVVGSQQMPFSQHFFVTHTIRGLGMRLVGVIQLHVNDCSVLQHIYLHFEPVKATAQQFQWTASFALFAPQWSKSCKLRNIISLMID